MYLPLFKMARKHFQEKNHPACLVLLPYHPMALGICLNEQKWKEEKLQDQVNNDLTEDKLNIILIH